MAVHLVLELLKESTKSEPDYATSSWRADQLRCLQLLLDIGPPQCQEELNLWLFIHGEFSDELGWMLLCRLETTVMWPSPSTG